MKDPNDGTQETTDPKDAQRSTRALRAPPPPLSAELRGAALDAKASRMLSVTMWLAVLVGLAGALAIIFGCRELDTLASSPEVAPGAPGAPPATPMLDATMILGAWAGRELLPGGLLFKVAKLATPLGQKLRDSILGSRPVEP